MSSETHRVNIASDSIWEPLRGYSRAVKVGESLFISGTTAMMPRGEVIGLGDAYQQTRYVIQVIGQVLRSAGFDFRDVVRTRLYITDISRWDEYARAHREVFEKIRPASSIVEVARLKDPRLMIEMEAEALSGHRDIEASTMKYPEAVS